MCMRRWSREPRRIHEESVRPPREGAGGKTGAERDRTRIDARERVAQTRRERRRGAAREIDEAPRAREGRHAEDQNDRLVVDERREDSRGGGPAETRPAPAPTARYISLRVRALVPAV